ncbi:hypothetical protein [Tautonia rosea]|uniref:hypothetical protein n=1 Tax=Tautonia rosea TaxID=2728037 RepID=UPI001473ED96|nr:hypothetical protein [Tautonia rosea]
MPIRDELFDDDLEASPHASEPQTPHKPFSQYLRETPPTPLTQGTKLALWVTGGLTILLFLASLLKMANK